MKDHAEVCPTERKALAEVYGLAKGGEWTDSKNWMHEDISCCDWKGVTCDDTGKVEVLNLSNNGLSGKLSASLGDLHALKVLDLSDNDIKVNQPIAQL
jgi:Leucine-rich repeat (LRR) protein